MKPLSIIPANDTFRALQVFLNVYEGKKAVFITLPELNGLLPETNGLSDQVDDDVALIIESSGSTGKPKRINLSLEALKASAESSAKRLGGHGQWLLALPINYIAGANVLFRSVAADTAPVMMNLALPFTAEAFFRSASYLNHERKYTSLVPIQLQRVIQSARLDAGNLALLRKFNAILVGGQAVPQSLLAEARALGVNVVESYGMAETCGGCVYDGIGFDGILIELTQGLVSISGPVLANNLGESFITNDLGQIEAGRLKVLGRKDRVIISGGLKLSLDVVEEFASGLQGVEFAVASSLESEFGQGLAIVYSGEDSVKFTELEAEFGVLGRPLKVVRVPKIPTLPNQKTDLVAIAALIQG